MRRSTCPSKEDNKEDNGRLPENLMASDLCRFMIRRVLTDGWLPRLIGECAQQKQLTFLFQGACQTQRKEISVLTLVRQALCYRLHWLSLSSPGNALLCFPCQTLKPFLFS
jgi:hypothetical protein